MIQNKSGFQNEPGFESEPEWAKFWISFQNVSPIMLNEFSHG